MTNISNIVPLNVLDARPWGVIVAESSVFLLINTVGILGNLFLCVAVYKNATIRGTCNNILLVTLSIADLLISLVAMPMTAAALISGTWHFLNIGCQIQGFLVHLLAFVSLQMMALTAFSRYLRVIRPSRFRKLFTRKCTIGMILITCSVSTVFLATLTFGRSSSFIFHPHKAICVLKFPSILYSRVFTLITGLIYVIAPATVITVCYCKIFRAIRKHNKIVNTPSTGVRSSIDTGSTNLSIIRVSPPETDRRPTVDTPPSRAYSVIAQVAERSRIARLSAVEIKITKTVLAIILAFAFCWVPCFVIEIIDTQVDGWLDRRAYLTYTFLAYTSSAVNPLIYGGMYSSFKKKNSKWLERRCRELKNNK